MISIAQCRYKINPESVSWLKQKGVEIPENAVSLDYVLVPKCMDYTESFTFKDKLNLRLKQQKNKVNKETNEKDIQIREYDYTKRFTGKEKITEIRQKNINPQGAETIETWRFYHPKDSSTVRFSHKSGDLNKNNYLEADGFITDNNGLKIRPISTAEYVDKRRDISDNNFIDSPWTLKQAITTNEKCATDSIQECTVVGIYGDKGISLNHLNPHHPANSKFNVIENKLTEELEQQGKNAKAFVIGASNEDYVSSRQFNNIIDFLATRGVKYSRFKTGDKVLGEFNNATERHIFNSRKFKNGTASPYEWQPGHHIIYDSGEVQIANPVIDAELKKGKTDPEYLIKKSFDRIYR